MISAASRAVILSSLVPPPPTPAKPLRRSSQALASRLTKPLMPAPSACQGDAATAALDTVLHRWGSSACGSKQKRLVERRMRAGRVSGWGKLVGWSTRNEGSQGGSGFPLFYTQGAVTPQEERERERIQIALGEERLAWRGRRRRWIAEGRLRFRVQCTHTHTRPQAANLTPHTHATCLASWLGPPASS